MLCIVCTHGLEGIWDPSKTKRVCLLRDIPTELSSIQDSPFISRVLALSCKRNDLYTQHPDKYLFAHHKSRKSFENSIREGCVMCQTFEDHLESNLEVNPEIESCGCYSMFAVSFQSPRRPYMMHIYLNDYSVEFELCRYVQDENWNINITSSIGDVKSWKLTQKWVSECVESHHCTDQLIKSSASIPHRLLYLELPLSSRMESTFRLIPADTLNPNTSYVALSHCFELDSDKSLILLSRSTEQWFSTSQPISILSQLFRDTLEIAERLGISYVWIDLLCTLQDDLVEKALEKKFRPDIFRNSFLAIGATGMTDLSSSLFINREPRLVAPTIVNIPIDISEITYTLPYICSWEYPLTWRAAFKADPLFHSPRGITDRSFSRRMLHFGSKMMFWECHSALCAEIHPNGVDKVQLLGNLPITPPIMGRCRNYHLEKVWVHKPWKSHFSMSPSWEEEEETKPIQKVYTAWVAILESYSSCHARTVEKRMAPLAEIVDYMKMMLPSHGCLVTGYMFGMWKVMLPVALLWEVYRPNSRIASTIEIPSWSWISQPGKIMQPSEKFYGMNCVEMLCTVVEFGGVEMDDSKESQATQSQLILTGKVGIITLAVSWPTDMLFSGTYYIATDDGGLVVGRKEPTTGDSSEEEVLASFHFDKEYEKNSFHGELENHPYSCLPILIARHDDANYSIYGLILSRLASGCYCRRGVWRIREKSLNSARDMFGGLSDRRIPLI